MGLLVDHQILGLCEHAKMIDPFISRSIREIDGRKAISYGVSSAGYDIRVGEHFKVFTNALASEVDPKGMDEKAFLDIERFVTRTPVRIPPNSFALAQSHEYIKMPRDVIAICLGKSTYARCGIIVNVTPLEPGWEGHITIEISNTTPLPALIYPMEGICQLLFFKLEEACDTSYADRGGKYQGQTGITLPRV